MDRDLDGVYFRIQRGEKWDNVCFSDLTEDEMHSILSNRETDWLKSLCIELGKTIRKIGDQFYLACSD